MTKQRYGKTKSGVDITEEFVERVAGEAEAGYDLDRLKPRRGRPPMGSEAATTFQVRIEPELRQALDDRARSEGVSPSELVRRILRTQLGGKRRKRA